MSTSRAESKESTAVGMGSLEVVATSALTGRVPSSRAIGGLCVAIEGARHGPEPGEPACPRFRRLVSGALARAPAERFSSPKEM